MQAVDIHVLARAALDALKVSGASAKTLREYEKTGFVELRRRFRDHGQQAFSEGLADVIVAEARAELDGGVIRGWRWRAIRRAAHVLTVFSATGGVERPPSPQWGLREPVKTTLRKAPV